MKSLVFLLPLLFTFALMYCSLQNDENALRVFIDSHIKLIEPKNKAMALADWNANATGDKKYYDEKAAIEVEINKIYSNKGDFEQLKKWKASSSIAEPILQRQLILLYNNYVKNQMDTALMRQIVEKGSEIANKFNTFRPILDDKEVDDNAINNILKDETNSTKRQKVWEASKEVGKAVAPMIVELAKLRNEAARQLGFTNFYEMSLITSEQTVSEVTAIFDELKTLTDEPFKKLKSDIDTKLAKKYGIKSEQMRPWHYQDRFFQEPPQIGSIDFDKYFKGKNVDKLGETFYANIGLPVDDILEHSDIFGRKGKYQHAFATDIDRLGDVRTMLSIVDNYNWMGTMLHELGHCVYSKNVNRDLPYLLRVESHTFLTEAIAMLMERQASNADWLQVMVGVNDKDKAMIRTVGQENLRMKALIFCRWTQVMMRFEKGMYENPDQDLNKLWWNLVKEYQMVTPPEGRNAPDWAAKIHLALYPAYYHNYQLGELAASQIQDYIIHRVIKEQSSEQPTFASQTEVGEYLKTRIFASGASLRWDELVKEATNEPFSAKSFAKEYVK